MAWLLRSSSVIVGYKGKRKTVHSAFHLEKLARSIPQMPGRVKSEQGVVQTRPCPWASRARGVRIARIASPNTLGADRLDR